MPFSEWVLRRDPASASAPVRAEDLDLELVPITTDNVRAVCKLSVREDQTRFVTSAAISLAKASAYPQA